MKSELCERANFFSFFSFDSVKFVNNADNES